MRRSAELIRIDISSENSLETAQAVYNNLTNHGKILISVSNYCKWALKVTSVKILAGEVHFSLVAISAGKEGGWSASLHTDPQTSNNTEGYITWTMDTHSFCIIYWRVGTDDEDQTNALGLGCRPYSDSNDKWAASVEQATKIKSDTEYLNYREYNNGKEEVVQYCNDKICVQGELSFDSDDKSIIEIFPRDEANVASSLESVLTQEIIDSYVEGYDKGSDIAAHIGTAVGVTAAVILSIVIAILLKKAYLKYLTPK